MEYFAAKPFVLNILQAVAFRKPMKQSILRPKYPNRVGGGGSFTAIEPQDAHQPERDAHNDQPRTAKMRIRTSL
jgi:hypothetical protein